MSTGAQRTPLSRVRALQAAVALADDEGIDAVSMRNLAGRLGVVPMALYKHVANKDDLLGGMVDQLIAQYAPSDEGRDEALDWREGVRHRVLSARRVLLEHPWARAVIESRTTRTPAVLGYQDSLVGQFIAGGFTADQAHHVMHALGHRIWGFSPEAFDDPQGPQLPEDEGERAAAVAEFQRTYPNIVAVALASGGQCDADAEFVFTLDLLLDAFERLRSAGWSSGAIQ